MTMKSINDNYNEFSNPPNVKPHVGTLREVLMKMILEEYSYDTTFYGIWR